MESEGGSNGTWTPPPPVSNGNTHKGPGLSANSSGQKNNSNASDKIWWLPFSYDTLTISVKGYKKVVLGGDAGAQININMKALREADWNNFDFTVAVGSFDVSLGVSAETSGLLSLTGSNGTVRDQRGVSLIGRDGVGFNAIGCKEVCAGASGVIDGHDPTGFSSFSWVVGGGEGVDLSVNLVSATDWFVYAKSPDPSQWEWRVPFINREFGQTIPIIGTWIK
jgi:hypothetical protein